VQEADSVRILEISFLKGQAGPQDRPDFFFETINRAAGPCAPTLFAFGRRRSVVYDARKVENDMR
jgi:hypothetical protein